MGLFDRLIGRGKSGDQAENTDIAKTEGSKALQEQSSIERAIAERQAGIRLDQCLRIPFGDVAALGTAFAQMVPAFRTIAMKGVGYIPVNMGAHDVLKSAGQGLYYGAHVTPDGQSIMTKWMQAGTATAEMPFDPSMIIIAAMLASIEKRLEGIQETQEKILGFLEQDKQAEQQGNLKVLTDILEGYKHNWDNPQYLQNHHMKVLDIKQTAEKNIIFYQEQIAAAIKKLPGIHLDQAVHAAIDELGKLFSNYRMALYLYAFASFLEVLLLGNFRQEYLDQVAEKVQKYNQHYQSQLSLCRDMIRKFSAESVETQVVAGIGNASRALGKLIASAPVLQGPVEAWLQRSGESLLKGNDDKADRAAALFSTEKKIGSEAFEESIRNVAMIRNQTTDILFDGEALYLAVS